MTIIIEADSTFDKEALTKILDCCGEQPQSIEYMINKTCSCLLSPYSSESPVSTCCQRAVRYARMAFGLWDKGLRDSMFLLELTSHRLVVEACHLEEISQLSEERNAKDTPTVKDFEKLVNAEGEVQEAESLLSLCFPAPSSNLAAAVLRYGRKAIVYFKIPFEHLLLHAVFEPSTPSFSISWKLLDFYARQICASSTEAYVLRFRRSFDQLVPPCREKLDATTSTVRSSRISNGRFDLDNDALRNPASSRSSWTLIESNSPVVYGNDMLTSLGSDLPSGFISRNPPENVKLKAAAVPIERCDPREANVPMAFAENGTTGLIEGTRFSDIESKNEFSDDFLSDHFRNSRDDSLFREEWLDKPTAPSISPRSYRSTLISSPAWSNQSSSPSDDGDIFRPFQPPWTLRPPSPPFLQSYSSSSRSVANFMEDNIPFSVENSCCHPLSTDPGCAGPSTPYSFRSPLSKPRWEHSLKRFYPADKDLHAPPFPGLPTAGHFTSSTIPRYKQKQKRNDILHSGHFAASSSTGGFRRASIEEFSPYTSAERLDLTRPGSAPESDGVSSRAGPSRLGSLDSPWRRSRGLEKEGPFCQALSADHQDVLTRQAVSGEDWEVALLRQLQEEEEIAASVAHQISVDAAWIVKLQQFLAEQKLGHSPSSLSTSFELDRQLALQIQQEEANVSSRTDYPNSRPTQTRTPDPPESVDHNFECGICHESCGDDVKVSVVDCGHSYCRECLGSLARAKIEDNRYPIFCPDCLIDRSQAVKCQIPLDILQGLDLSVRELDRIEELQTLSHSVLLECPKCKERISINRPEYGERKFIICQEKECGYQWCRDCLKPIKSLDDRHRCKNENIERLMRRKGWKRCPGCRIPVQKESGCNHMTCGAPACNVHFCYRCGALIVDTTDGGDVGLTVTDHYANSNCRLFDRRYCTIQ